MTPNGASRGSQPEPFAVASLLVEKFAPASLSSSSATRKGQQNGGEDGDLVKDVGPPTRDQLHLAPGSSPLPSLCFEIRSQVALADF